MRLGYRSRIKRKTIEWSYRWHCLQIFNGIKYIGLDQNKKKLQIVDYENSINQPHQIQKFPLKKSDLIDGFYCIVFWDLRNYKFAIRMQKFISDPVESE